MNDHLAYWTEGREDGDLLFPNWKEKIANEAIKATAAAKGWDPGRKWDGVHTLRRGGTHEDEEVEDRTMQEKMRFGPWKQKTMAAYYNTW